MWGAEICTRRRLKHTTSRSSPAARDVGGEDTRVRKDKRMTRASSFCCGTLDIDFSATSGASGTGCRPTQPDGRTSTRQPRFKSTPRTQRNQGRKPTALLLVLLSPPGVPRAACQGRNQARIGLIDPSVLSLAFVLLWRAQLCSERLAVHARI